MLATSGLPAHQLGHKYLGMDLLLNELSVSARIRHQRDPGMGYSLARDSKMHESLATGGDWIPGVAGLVGQGHAIAAEHGLRNAVGTPRSAGVSGSFGGVGEVRRRKDLRVDQRQAATRRVSLRRWQPGYTSHIGIQIQRILEKVGNPIAVGIGEITTDNRVACIRAELGELPSTERRNLAHRDLK